MNRAAIFNRAKEGTLDGDQAVALAQVALRAMDRDRKVLSRCQDCGGSREYNTKTKRWYYDHKPGCPQATIEGIKPAQEES